MNKRTKRQRLDSKLHFSLLCLTSSYQTFSMDLLALELELKKRLNYPYYWGNIQCDSWDKSTRFIYNTPSFEELLERLSHLDQNLINYALNRWYNFWSAKAVEQLFCMHPGVIANKNKYDKLIDFKINDIPFDHKTSVFPKSYKQSFEFARAHKQELIEWLYQHQSQEGRKHLSNRLFVILYDKQQEEHWKLKAEIGLMKKAVDDYINSFSFDQLIKTKSALADIIWLSPLPLSESQ